MSARHWLASVVVVAAIGSSAAHAAPQNANVADQDFGPARVGATPGVSRTFDILNDGDQALVISDVRLGGTNPGDFTITAEPAAGTSIAPNGTASVTVVFVPQAAGARSATLLVDSNDPQSPTSSALTGVGTSAVIAVTDVDFGIVPHGGTGTGTITVSNTVTTNQRPLRVVSAAISGGSWFTFGTNAPSSCQNNRSCTFNVDVPPDKLVDVRCRPPTGASGSQTATVAFTSDSDPTGADAEAALSCTAGRADINVLTTPVVFGDVPINPSPPPTMSVTIGNLGNQTLTFTPSESSPLYTLGGCVISGCSAPPGMTAEFTVTFNPTSPTIPDANINITVTSNDPDNGTVTIPVVARGVGGRLAVAASGGGTTIAFGPVPVGGVATRTFTLTNTGNLPVDNIAAVVAPANVGYSIDPAGNPVPTTLAAGAGVTLTARFAPLSAADGGNATITFTGDWGAGPTPTAAVLSLTGDGQSAGYELSTPAINFGDLRFDATPERTFCITNTSESSVQIQSPMPIAPGTGTATNEFIVARIRRPATCGGSSTMDVTLPQTLATGQLLEVTVRADPANRTGPMQATLTVNSNLPTNPTRTLALTGNSTSGAFTLAPGSMIDLGVVDVLSPAVSTTIRITNTGDGTLDLSNFQVLMPNPAFTVTTPVSRTLAPTQFLDIPVSYKPTFASAAGSEETITLRHAIAGDVDGPSSQSIIIKGRGIDRDIAVSATPVFPDTFRNPGDQAPVGTVTIRNLGEATLKLTAVMLDNSAGAWQLLDASPVDLPKGAGHDFQVRFAPTIAGRTQARLLITHDDRKRPPVSIDLVGNGIDRSVRFTPDRIQIGYTGIGIPVRIEDAVAVTSADAMHAFVIRSIDLDQGSPFAIEGVTSDLELPALAERRFAVTFTPTAEGPFTAKARLFLDMDPTAQHEITIEGTGVYVDAHGGGGCATGGPDGAAGGGALALAALLGLRRRRREARRAASCARAAALVAAALALAPAAASADDIALSVFDPVPATTSNGFQLQAPDVGAAGDWVASAVFSHATDPLILGGPLNDYTAITRSTVMNLGLAVAFLGRWEAGARLPLYTQAGQPTGDPLQELTGRPAEGTARGDLALHAKARLVRKRLEGDGAFIAGVGGQLTLPTATRDQFTGVEDPTGRVLLLGSLMPGAFERRVTVTMNLGGVIRAPARYANLEQKSGVAWGLGVDVRALDPLWVAAEVYGDTVPSGRTDAMTRSRVLSPIEWLAGLRWKPDHRFTVGLAAGRGLTSAVGTPAFRGVLSLTLTPGAPEVRPIRTPKPDGDGDGDGVRDSVDRCADEPEDKDGFDDGDGCPDKDNDGDGVADAEDRCPLDAEDRDGFADVDGCPDKDNDGDGIADKQDRCPAQPEDRDGFADVDGCPEDDNDRDGVADRQDRCPAQPETINGNQDDDGCPDRGDSLVVLSPDRIEMLDALQFTANQKVAKASHHLLGQVGATLRARTEIARLRITVHVQPTGDSDRDQETSDRRAAAIREWLVQYGIAPQRLEVRGFGGDKPVVPPDRRGSATVNQRVELIILERK